MARKIVCYCSFFSADKAEYLAGLPAQINIYECRYTPCLNGKRISKNVYAKTREECEQKLAELIVQMKAEIAKLKKKNA